MEKKEFYYKFGGFGRWLWLSFTLLLAALAACCLIRWPICIYWGKMQIVLGVILVSFVLWGLMYLKKHRLAVIDENGITFDHCAPLAWKDIESAEDATAKCLFRKRGIIIVHPKEGTEYPYNPMQKFCMKSDFTAFSFPLYAMRAEDEAEVREILKEKGISFKDKS